MNMRIAQQIFVPHFSGYIVDDSANSSCKRPIIFGALHSIEYKGEALLFYRIPCIIYFEKKFTNWPTFIRFDSPSLWRHIVNKLKT